MNNRHKYSTDVAFLDTFLNIAIVAIALFMISFLLINPVAKKADEESVPLKTLYIISVEWSENTNTDLDLWVRDPHGEIVSFKSREVPGMSLDRDDTGFHTDTIKDAGGNIISFNPLNREVVSIRVPAEGKYTINTHFYGGSGSIDVKIEVTQISPYRIVTHATYKVEKLGLETSVMVFDMDKKGKISNIQHFPEEYFVIPSATRVR